MELNIKGPEFDENFFDPAKKSPYFHRFGYSRGEMVNIITDYLDWFSMPACRESIVLLQNTINFYDEMDPEVLAYKMEQSEEEIKEPFESMAHILKQATSQLHTLDRGSSDYKFLNLAINYSLEAIRRRLAKVKEKNFFIFVNYYATSSLKGILENQNEEKKEI